MKGFKIKKGLSLDQFIKRVYEPQKEYIRQKIADSENLRLRRYWEQKEKRLEKSYRFRQTRERLPEAFNLRIDIDRYKPQIQKVSVKRVGAHKSSFSGISAPKIDIKKLLEENKQMKSELAKLRKENEILRNKAEYKQRTGKDPSKTKEGKELGKITDKKIKIDTDDEFLDKIEKEGLHEKMSIEQRIRLVGNETLMSKLKDRLSSKRYSITEIKKILDPFREAVGRKAYIIEEPKLITKFKKYEKDIIKEQKKKAKK